MHRIWLSIATGVVSGFAIAFLTPPAAAQNDGFIFGGDQAVSVADKSQSIFVREKLSIPQLKKRFPSYSVSAVEGDCAGTCVLIKGKNGASIRIDYVSDSSYNFYRIVSSDARGSRDILGNIVGTPLRKAVGANTAKCDLGEVTTCESLLIKGLSYVVGGCTWKPLSVIPACAKVDGFEIMR
jgi:hypothetical protein